MFQKTLMGVLLTTLLGATPVLAQCDFDRDAERALATIERTREVVEQSGLPEARELLRAAQVRLKEGYDRARGGDGVLACRLVRVSIELAEKAGEVARRGVRGLEELQRMLERTDELLQETLPLVRESGSPEAARFLQGARSHQKEAWTAFRGRRQRFALKLTLMARESAGRARRLAEGRGDEDAGFVERELRQTDQLIHEAEPILAEIPGDEGEAALTRATRLQRQAWNQLQRTHPGLALGLTRQARVLVRRALGDADVRTEPGDVQILLESTRELLERLKPEVAGSGSTRAARLLAQAEGLLDEGQRQLAAGKVRAALGSVRAASALTLDISELLEPGGED